MFRNLAIVAFLIFGAPLAQAQGPAPDCEELRLACEHKDQLGEAGLGNCRRFRETCEQQPQPNCAELRRACLHKDELGERGQGNCRQYRENCTH